MLVRTAILLRTSFNICFEHLFLFVVFVSEAFFGLKNRRIDLSVLPKKIAVNVSLLLRYTAEA